MLDAGVPVVTAPPSGDSSPDEYQFEKWRHASVRMDVLERWRPGWMLGAITGIAFDVIDIDPRNGGVATLESLHAAVPRIAGVVATPGGGQHLYVAPTGMGKTSFGGIDYQGAGGLIYIPGCSRPKYEGAGYSWTTPIDWSRLISTNAAFPVALRKARAQIGQRGEGTSRPDAGKTGSRGSRYGRAALQREADQVGRTRHGRNTRLNEAAFRCGQLAAAGHLHSIAIVETLLDAANECGLLRDDGAAACRATINSGLRAGRDSPRPCGDADHA